MANMCAMTNTPKQHLAMPAACFAGQTLSSWLLLYGCSGSELACNRHACMSIHLPCHIQPAQVHAACSSCWRWVCPLLLSCRAPQALCMAAPLHLQHRHSLAWAPAGRDTPPADRRATSCQHQHPNSRLAAANPATGLTLTLPQYKLAQLWLLIPPRHDAGRCL